MIKVFPPCLIDDFIAGVFYDPTIFWAKHAGSAAGTPEDVLIMGRSLMFGPPPDSSSHTIKLVGLSRPNTLSSDSDQIVQDDLQDAVETGASVNVLLKLGDTAAAGGIYQYLQRLTMALQSLGAAIDIQGVKDAWNDKQLASSTGYGSQQQQQPMREGE